MQVRVRRSNCIPNSFKKILATSILFVTLSNSASSQFYLLGGFNINSIKHQYLQGSVNGMSGLQIGCSVNIRPILKLPKLSIDIQSLIIAKGYLHSIGSTRYDAFLWHLTLAILPKYTYKFISVQNGFSYEHRVAGPNPQFEMKFTNYDIAWISGINLFERRRLSFYVQYMYGLKALYNYYKFDKLGNFTEEVEDVKFRTLSFGIKVKMMGKQYDKE